MRYLTVPNNVTVLTNNGPISYSFEAYLVEHVWGHQWWRGEPSGTTRIDMLIALKDKFRGVESGQVVELENEWYEAFRPLAMQQGVQLVTGMADTLLSFFRAVASATTTKPEAPPPKE